MAYRDSGTPSFRVTFLPRTARAYFWPSVFAITTRMGNSTLVVTLVFAAIARFAIAPIFGGTFAAVLLVGMLAILLVPTWLVAVFRTMANSVTAAQALPSAITFAEEGLIVEPREGAPAEEKWTWIARAERRGKALVLVLQERPPMYAILGPLDCGRRENYERLVGWLAQHGRFDT
jgi:hypothetical protein